MTVQALPADDRASWLKRHRWGLGSVLLAAVAGGIWWRTTRPRPINVGSVSERWLAEQAFDAGQRPQE